MIRRDSAGSAKQPVVVGLVVEVLGKRRVFLPMTRVTSMDSEQVLCTGLVNLRRFEQRGSEILVVGEMFDRTVTMRDGSGTATIIDVGMELARSGDWQVTQLFVRRGPSAAASCAVAAARRLSSTGTRPPTRRPSAISRRRSG